MFAGLPSMGFREDDDLYRRFLAKLKGHGLSTFGFRYPGSWVVFVRHRENPSGLGKRHRELVTAWLHSEPVVEAYEVSRCYILTEDDGADA